MAKRLVENDKKQPITMESLDYVEAFGVGGGLWGVGRGLVGVYCVFLGGFWEYYFCVGYGWGNLARGLG